MTPSADRVRARQKVQDAKGERRHGREVHRGNGFPVICSKTSLIALQAPLAPSKETRFDRYI
jgi:hypothetical protein